MRSVSVLLLLPFLVLISCQQERQLQLETVKYRQLSLVEGWGDSIFLSQVRGLQFYDNVLYISDQYLSQVIETDNFFDFNRSIGRRGSGPEDFVSIESIALEDSFLYVFDMGHCATFCFEPERGFRSKYTLLGDRICMPYRFFVEDSCLYVSTAEKEGLFLEVDMRMGKKSYYGKRKDFGADLPNRIRNSRHLLKHNNKCIVVSDNIPMIEIYDLNSKQMVDSLDFSNIDYIRKNLIENENIRQQNSYTMIVSDAYIDCNYLYILLFGTSSSGGTISNEILKIELSPVLKIKEIIQLPGTIYRHICVNHDSIYAYNRREARIELLVRE